MWWNNSSATFLFGVMMGPSSLKIIYKKLLSIYVSGHSIYRHYSTKYLTNFIQMSIQLLQYLFYRREHMNGNIISKIQKIKPHLDYKTRSNGLNSYFKLFEVRRASTIICKKTRTPFHSHSKCLHTKHIRCTNSYFSSCSLTLDKSLSRTVPGVTDDVQQSKRVFDKRLKLYSFYKI